MTSSAVYGEAPRPTPGDDAPLEAVCAYRTGKLASLTNDIFSAGFAANELFSEFDRGR